MPPTCLSIFEMGLKGPIDQREPGNLLFASRLLFGRRPNSYGLLYMDVYLHVRVCVCAHVHGHTKNDDIVSCLFTMIYVDLV